MLDLSQVSTEILNKLGSNGYVKLVRVDSTYDPVTGSKSQIENVIDLAAVDLPVPKDLIDGEMIVATDKRIIMDGAIEPSQNDLIRINNIDYQIITITPINHAGVPQLYIVIARG